MTHPLVKKYSPSKEEIELMLQEIFPVELTLDFEVNDTPKTGEMVHGTVVGFRENYAIVDFNCKVEGWLPYPEEKITDDLDVGDKIHVIVTGLDEKTEQIKVTRVGVDTRLRRLQLLQTISIGDRVLCQVKQFSKSGWTVLVEGCLEATLPLPVCGFSPTVEAELIIGTEVEAEVVDLAGETLVLSRKSIAEKERKASKENFFSNIETGMIVEGVVKNLTDFGAFIQLAPGVFGLCHSTDYGKPVAKNDKIRAKVLKVDRAKNKIALSIKQADEPVWEDAVSKYLINDVISVRVKNLVNFGAFVELEPGVHGLIYISDMSWSEHVKHPSEILKEEDLVDVIILAIDREKKRISLGLKQLKPNPWDTIADRYLVGTSVTGTVVNKTTFGVFVELEAGVDGLLPKDRSLRVGDSVQVIVKKIDAAAKKISLDLE